ncbi:DUF1801 domain-containing protein [Phycisphaeraceae bacterium D3-23]
MQDEVDTLLSGSTDRVRAIALKLIDSVRKAVPKQAHVSVKPGWRCVAFGTGPKMGEMVCAVIPHKAHVNLQLMQGASLADPEGLLEGTGKAVRHVKICSEKEAAQRAVKDLVKAGFAFEAD